jgi:uncharacterized repeat protein (TIGR02059 family)
MKKSLILLFLLFLFGSLTISAATYYVSPSGSDSNPGTIGQPFFTLNKAWSVVSAGDIIYMRGGTYRYNNTGSSLTGKSGTSGNLISILAYPGEKPIINYDNVTFTSQLVGISLQNDSYIYFKGIRVTGINQPAAGSTAQYGIILWDKVSNCTFEQMETDHIGGWGVVIGSNSNNDLFLNCDSHHNADPNTGSYNGEPYGWSDGFESGSHGANTSTNIIFRGCRAWSNSDDGWDLRQADGVYTIENCWSFWNGYIPGTQNQGGDGEGYKLGGSTSQTSSIIRTVKNCLAFENRLVGFSPEPDVEPNYDLGVAVYNSTSYHNALGINFQYKSVAILKNNIIYANTVGAMYSWGANVTHDHNAGVISDLTNTVTDADFQSVNSAGMDGPRQADGSLPNLSFLHLAAGSKLIDAGVDVGLPYTGKAPDLGAFEAQSGSTPAVPAYTSSAVANATPSIVEMTYNMTLANIVPAASAFSVLVNSAARSVSAVAISGAKVQLTLANAIKYGDIVTVVYTKPATNPLQSTAGGLATSISSSQSVVNNVINSSKDGTPVTITMTVTPNHVHKIINALLTYSATPTTANTPELIRISDLSGNLFLEKELVTGVTNVKIPINLTSGIYTVAMMSGGLQMASQRMIVY